MGAAEVERVLAVMAHPDDAEFWLGGTNADLRLSLTVHDLCKIAKRQS